MGEGLIILPLSLHTVHAQSLFKSEPVNSVYVLCLRKQVLSLFSLSRFVEITIVDLYRVLNEQRIAFSSMNNNSGELFPVQLVTML